MRELVQPAMEFAQTGFEIVPFQYLDFELLEPILRVSPISNDIYFNADGSIKNIGESQRMPQTADFLDFISREGEAAFYKGEIAKKIAQDQADNGGYLTREDFENYEVIVREPLQFGYHQHKILTNPLPSTGGSLMALLMMNLDKVTDNHLSKSHILNLHKALEKVADYGKLPHQLAKALTANLKKHGSKHGSTTHFNIVDKHGNAVSLTSTNGEGCGYYIENTQVHLNNMLGEAALVPEGFHNWKPNTRLSSMMSPTIVLDKNDEFKAALGSGGAGRIPSMITQVLHQLIDYNLSGEEAVKSPRVHLSGNQFSIEKIGFEELPTANELNRELILFNKKSLFFGGVHSIVNEKGKLVAVADERRDGVIM